MAGAFQSDAFQNDAFQVDTAFTGGSGQAQAWISVRTFQHAQAQADVKATNRQYGQSQAQILNPYPRYISNTSWDDGNNTSHDITIPAVEAGDILLIVMAVDNDLSTTTSVSGFTKITEDSDGDGFVHAALFKKVASSSASSTTATITHTTSQACAGTVLLIRNGSAIEYSWSGGNNNTPDPANLAPSWGSAATLWLAFYGIHSWIDFTSQPSGYTHITNGRYPDVGQGVSYGVSYKRATASSENPGVFTLGQSERWAAYTIGIQPALSLGSGQAQASILATTNRCAQSQADVKATSQQYAQSQADIKQTSQAYGQAQGTIASRSNQYAQCQAYILSHPTQSGQANADILATSNAFAQANAWIAAQFVVDTFTRTIALGSGLGTPDVGPAYADAVFDTQDLEDVEVTGTTLKLTGTSYDTDWVIAYQNPDFVDYIVYMDFKSDSLFHDIDQTVIQIRMRYSVGWNTAYVWYSDFSSVQRLSLDVAGTPGDQADIADLQNDTWYTLKFMGYRDTVRIKVFPRGGVEPDWQIVYTDPSHAMQSGYWQLYADVGNSGLAHSEFDNLFIGYLTENTRSYNSAQAQASIVSKRTSCAQALARVKQTTNRSAQARAVIINPAWGQAQADIKATSNAFGQAQAYISAQLNVANAQAQAQIYRYEGYGQAQALIDSTRNYGQAQTYVDHFWNWFATYPVPSTPSATLVTTTLYSREVEPSTALVTITINSSNISGTPRSIYVEAGGVEYGRWFSFGAGDSHTVYADIYTNTTLNIKADITISGSGKSLTASGTVSTTYPKQGYWKLAEQNANYYVQSEYGPTGWYTTSNITYQVDTPVAYSTKGITVASGGAVRFPLDYHLDTFSFEIWFKTSGTINGTSEAAGQGGIDGALTTTQYIIPPASLYFDGIDHMGLTVGTNGIAVVGDGYGGMFQLAHWYGSISSAKWHHALVTVNDRRPLIYLDGQQVAVGIVGANGMQWPYQLFSPVVDAYGHINSSAYYVGSATGFKVYDRVLTPQEAHDAYESGLPRGFGQAQADIYQPTPLRYGQAQADILATNNSFAQAQALIIHYGSGQAQAQITGLNSQTGQAQGQIFRYEGYGQALAFTVIVTRRSAQAQAILPGTVTRRSAQAQAKIVPSRVTGYSRAVITREGLRLYIDTFNRNTAENSTGWGTTPGFGGTWVGSSPFTYQTINHEQAFVFNSNTSLVFLTVITLPFSPVTQSDNAWEASWTWILQNRLTTGNQLFSILIQDTLGQSIEVGLDRANIRLYGSINGASVSTPHAAGPNIGGATGTVSLRYDFTTGELFGKFVYFNASPSLDFPEEDWVLLTSAAPIAFASTTRLYINVNHTSNTNSGITSRTVQFFADGAGIRAGQAQAYITQLEYQQYGQAQAQLESTVQNQYGQAQALITILTTRVAQARALINTGLRTGLAQAYIKATVRGSAQAQAQISTKRIFAQANARIKGRPTRSANARAVIISTAKSGQAMAFIRVIYKAAQAQAKLIGTEVPSAQALGLIDSKGAVNSAQALGLVLGTGTRLRTGQAQASIGSFKSAQAQANIRVPAYRSGQAQALIKGKVNVSGQANARILRDNGNARAQAQGTIRKASPKSGQAQAVIMSPNPCRFAQAQAKITGVEGSTHYLVRFGSWVLPGIAQREEDESIMILEQKYTGSTDGSKAEQLGLQNKEISIDMKILHDDYLQVKLEAQRATTILRSARGWEKLYVQREDRYLLVLTKKVNYEHAATNSSKQLDYSATFEAKPWWFGEDEHLISGTGTLVTTGRSLDDGGWTPTTMLITGTDVTVSGYDQFGNFAGFISVSGSVTNLEIDSDNYTATINGVNAEPYVINKDYQMYVGPGETTFVITGASNVEISWRNRWYL